MHLESEELLLYCEFLDSTLNETADIIRRYYRQPHDVIIKADESPVTTVDKDVEQLFRKRVAEVYDDHGIFGEEFGFHSTMQGINWVIDPIDGTLSFMSGRPLFATLVALANDGMPVLGVIDQPIIGERWLGLSEQRTTLNGSIVSTSGKEFLSDAILATTNPDYFDDAGCEKFIQIAEQVQHIIYGGDAYNYALLASGHVDIVVESGLKPYDFAALVPVIEGAGGKITDWQGKPLTLQSNGDVVASASHDLHTQALTVLAE